MEALIDLIGELLGEGDLRHHVQDLAALADDILSPAQVHLALAGACDAEKVVDAAPAGPYLRQCLLLRARKMLYGPERGRLIEGIGLALPPARWNHRGKAHAGGREVHPVHPPRNPQELFGEYRLLVDHALDGPDLVIPFRLILGDGDDEARHLPPAEGDDHALAEGDASLERLGHGIRPCLLYRHCQEHISVQHRAPALS